MSDENYLYQKSSDAQTEAITVKSIADFIALQHDRNQPNAEDYASAEDTLLLAILNKSQALSKIWLQAGMPSASEVPMTIYLI